MMFKVFENLAKYTADFADEIANSIRKSVASQ